jgi:hypothetical protein
MGFFDGQLPQPAAGIYPIQIAAMNGSGVVVKLVTLTVKKK